MIDYNEYSLEQLEALFDKQYEELTQLNRILFSMSEGVKMRSADVDSLFHKIQIKREERKNNDV